MDARRYAALQGLDLASLLALIEVIDTGSFTEAARAMGVSQPAVSAAIKKLEERLGTQLLVRTRKGVTPARPGRTLAQGATLAFDSLAGAVDQIADEQTEPRGRVRLGCHESLAAYAQPGYMARFLRAYPLIELVLWNGRSAEVERALIESRVDLGLVVNPSHHGDTVIQHLFDDSVELICARRIAARRPPQQVVASAPLLFVPELTQSQTILRELEKRSLRPERLLSCSSLELVKNLVLDRVGVGILPWRVAHHGIPAARLHSLSPPLPAYRDRVALVRRFDLPRTAAVRAVTDALLAHGHTLAAPDPR